MSRPLVRSFAPIAGLILAFSACGDSTEPAVPGTLQVVAGAGQTAAAGTPVAVDPAVKLLSTRNRPMSGVVVTFAASANGAVTPATVTTDAQGVATLTSWTLPTQAGSHQLTISTAGLTPVVMLATAEAGPPAQLAIATQPSTFNGTGLLLGTQPVVEVRDQFGNRAENATGAITAALAPGSLQTLSGTTTVPVVGGRGVFTDLAVSGIGNARLQFVSGTLTPVTSAEFNVPASTLCPGTPAVLELALGESRRWLLSSAEAPSCLDFPQALVTGREYLLLFENISLNGNSDTGLFPGVATGLAFTVWVDATGAPAGNTVTPRVSTAPSYARHAWDFGAGPIYEVEPPEPPGGVPPVVLRRAQQRLDANVASAAAAVGDTVSIFMAAIPRLNIPDSVRKAVVRYVGADLIIAEDVRLATLTREGGGTNTPLLPADMEAIAADYAQYARVQADLFFQNRHNSTTEAAEGKIIAIHSLMFADNIWGYTYPSQNYFVWDYWAGTNGSTKGVNQSVQRNANNLFMHEIAHMRHYGMNERVGRTAARGNRWLVEGFARATERWPITMRLTGVTEFSRTGNIQLPLFSPTSLSSMEDVPLYLAASQSVYEGYGSASYIFDYFADQVALTGADWRAALGAFLVHAGVEADLNNIIAQYLPGIDVATLFTRARAALFLDDYVAGLPAWTQYHQFNLRASRTPANTQSDPRNQWPRILAGTAFSESRQLAPGTAFGFVIDGTSNPASTRLALQFPSVARGLVSITRIR